MQVDDILEKGGYKVHRENMTSSSRSDDLKKLGGSMFNGRLLEQTQGGTASPRMDDSIRMKLQQIPFDKPRNRNKFRGVVQSLMCLARQAKPDIMGQMALLARKLMAACVEELVEANRIVAHCKTMEGMRLNFEPARPKDSIFVAIAAASSTEVAGERHPQGASMGCDLCEGLGEGATTHHVTSVVSVQPITCEQ